MIFELVIFDCDGVLVDSETISNSIFVELLAEMGFPITIEECFHTFTGRSAKVNRETIERLTGTPISTDFSERFHAKMTLAFEQHLQPISGIETALAAISSPMCVASSSAPELIYK